MLDSFKKALVIAGAVFLAVAPAHSALTGRDINGFAVAGSSASAVFLYDDDRDITWLRDANVNGRMTWAQAVAWASAYSKGIYDDWRLPSAVNADGTGPFSGNEITGSEMGHLWYTELGNTPGPMTKTGDFQNFQNSLDSSYWSGTVYPPGPSDAWLFYAWNGHQNAGPMADAFYAMAVRDGDVLATTPVPEPASLVMMLAGLGALAIVLRRKQKEVAGPGPRGHDGGRFD